MAAALLPSHISAAIDDLSDQFLTWAHPNAPAPPTVDFPFMTLQSSLIAVTGYWLVMILLFALVKVVGPFEGTRQYQIVYNLLQIGLCSFLCGMTAYTAITERYSLICNGVRSYNDPKLMATLTWLFYVSKALDFFDTFFIILKAKWDQLSFLHLYHHTSIFIIYWMNARVCFAGDIYITIVLNTFVHVVMYFYYFLCTINCPPRWKPLVTIIQLVQFVLMVAQASWMLFRGCAHPAENVIKMFLLYIISLLFLFGHFFVNAYLKKKRLGGGRRPKPSKAE